EHRTPITEHRLSRVEYVFERIQRPVVLADLVMEVRPGGAAGRSDETDTLAAPDALPLVDEDRVHVSIDRRVTGGMRDCDRLAVIAYPPALYDYAFGRRQDRLVKPSRDVESRMKRSFSGERIGSGAEPGVEEPPDRGHRRRRRGDRGSSLKLCLDL